ncbi:MAG: hypothetical protein K2Z81_08500, partial [Cyanobacteria bacterium]|nr:hypothetical protein [Cyanobacteriota bacterium]
QYMLSYISDDGAACVIMAASASLCSEHGCLLRPKAASKATEDASCDVVSLVKEQTHFPIKQTALSVSLGQQFIGHCGEDNLITAKNLERMAALFCASIKFSDAEPLYSRAFTIRKKSAQKVSDGSFIEDYIALLRILGKDKEAAELQKQKGKR